MPNGAERFPDSLSDSLAFEIWYTKGIIAKIMDNDVVE